ncbi:MULTISPECIES: hypothetical protein [unclassified Nocardiopsis]|uniref:hypothetical protein n=1 Tax=unclassified Nocardiopsis TaxID=2649073 RepID=UPI0033ECEA3C
MNSSPVDPDDTLDPVQQRELVDGVVRALVGACPPGWSEITFEVTSLARLTTIGNRVTRDGAPPARETFPHSVNGDVIRLRRGMYREGVGTWFSLRLHVLPPGRFRIDFDYDRRPGGTLPPGPQEFAEDLRTFPRTPEHVPAWLREELARAYEE